MENKKNEYNEEIKQFHCSLLMDEVKETVEKLKEYGINMNDIMSCLRNNQPLQPLFVSRDYKIYIGDEYKEIYLQPLVKAVYLLFLRHPEGILFKCLPDFREELTQIYIKLKPCGMSDKVLQSIEDVTNPLHNSINEKCARIRGAFLEQFDDYLAKHYYVDGRRGEPKKITLPRDLVIWE